MQLRKLGRSGVEIPEIGLGCWQLGGGWGNSWDNDIAQKILESAYRAGVRFIDTADVYGEGASELSVGEFLRRHDDVTVATKLGRGAIYPNGYTRDAVRSATLRSIERLGVSRLDLTQLHCVPLAVLREGKIFDWLRELRDEGLISHFGASVETVEEGLVCLEQQGLTSLQIIFNIFRQKPLQELLPCAQEKGVGIIVRLPLASGLLSGKMTRDTVFRAGDHRHFNRDGQQFNVGETFAGIEFATGVSLAEQVAAHVPEGMAMAQMALRWILDHDAVSVIIPGASSPSQVEANCSASQLPALSSEVHRELADFYRERIHAAIRGPY
ncbi:aldo/keto reductase [Collimonas silvisoli]|uniref:aldo/keto reductase n=1 Tax=Collimonas silvisoli TaxID=2825884 RepID=UPI001B8D63EF|nr:aldo/keto reductase [Collimonas silvisoli]